ncbi:hypothetical protein [Hymenobacter sp. GOD-10R]|uniref:hypothetical protein n=1 Tax=Hymenobacter sp. GOD-10R TaxID=3093922 RepID=UPI002D781661|nr:hypothetical protein [Hymenobacter sp. GOD-10R]WRQ31687.1 hypothetical protein SD425_28665 [Hymenobacter sp. GOD-10R]
MTHDSNAILLKAWLLKHYNKLSKVLDEVTVNREESILGSLRHIIDTEEDAGILVPVVRAYFRIKRAHLVDCRPLFEVATTEKYAVKEALLEVLGYDRMVPTSEEQERIINTFFHFGQGLDLRSRTDPRYGLAAACAGWDPVLVKPFLLHCLHLPDAPLKHVASKALKQQYTKLRGTK